MEKEKNTNTMTFAQFEKAVEAVTEIVGDDWTAIRIIRKVIDIFDIQPSENPEELIESLFGCALSDLFK